MADVFLSYARGDRSVAERLANAIGDAGLTVWWDRHIKGGSEFSRDIERQLNDAKRVLVLWSKEAINSRWVRDEASEAADSGKLVSVTVDGTPPPLGFRQFQTIDLKGWSAKGAPIPSELAEALEVDAPAPAAASQRQGRRKLVIGGIGALLLAGAATIAIVRPGPMDQLFSGEKQDQQLALAIMPFVTQGGQDIAYLGPGLSSALSDSLAALPGLRITASTSTQALAGKRLTAPEIAKQLGITHLVEGDIEKAGDRFTMSVRLIDAKLSEQIWARSFDGRTDELQGLKSQIAHELAGAIRARLGVGEGEVADRGKVDPEAYEAYLRALERISVRDDRRARLEAIKQFRLAASIQPDFAEAHAGHAYLMALSSPHQIGMSWQELIGQQRRSTERALALDPDNDLALVAKATALQNFEGEIEKSLAIGQTVLKRSPNLGPANYTVAAGLWMSGRSREALDHLELAIDRDPFDTLLRFYRAKVLYSLGDYQGVRHAADQCAQRCAGIGWYWLLAMAGFGDEDLYRDDFPLVAKRAQSDGLSPEEIEEGRSIIEAFILGRRFTPEPIEEGRYVEFADAAVEGHLLGFDEGMRVAKLAIAVAQPDSVLDILNEGRVTFTPEQRADPRYHALFKHPKLAKIAAARRKAGVTAGLPVFPVKPYTGR